MAVIIGRGVYSTVFCITHKRHGKCAVKQFNDIDDNETGVSVTTLREMTILMRLKHPHVTKVFEIAVHKDSYMLIMEHCWHTLRDAISTDLTMDSARRYLTHILSALSYLHENDIIHRDLKPENILIDNQMNAKLTDFGLSRTELFYQAAQYTPGMVTLYYRAPEILTNVRYSTAVDVWSAGCIFAEMSTGKVLYEADSEIGVMGIIQKTSFAKKIAQVFAEDAQHVASMMIAWCDQRQRARDVLDDCFFSC